jgi:hypothetical protein
MLILSVNFCYTTTNLTTLECYTISHMTLQINQLLKWLCNNEGAVL